MAFTEAELLERIAELEQESREENDMWAEARAQWLQSCWECGDQYLDGDLDDLENDAHFWLDNMITGCDDKPELEPGGIYHWMKVAQEQCPLPYKYIST